MRAELGLILRLGGFLIEAVSVIMLVNLRGKGRTIAGLPIEYPIYALLALGVVAWAAGIVATRLAIRRPRDD